MSNCPIKILVLTCLLGLAGCQLVSPESPAAVTSSKVNPPNLRPSAGVVIQPYDIEEIQRQSLPLK